MRPLSHPLVLLFVIATVGTATAEVAGDREARARFQRGKALVAQHKLADAYDEFARGFAASGRPAFLFNMGEAARGIGELANARDAYERYLRAEPDGQYAAVARQRLADMPRPDAPPPPPVAPQPVPVVAPAPAVIPPPARVALTVDMATPTALERPAPNESSASRPLWKRWPLWAGIGIVIVGGAAATYMLLDRPATCGGDPMCLDLRGRP